MTAVNERYKLNKELAQMLKGGVIMDVTTPEQAHIAEEAGACAVMALERIPAAAVMNCSAGRQNQIITISLRTITTVSCVSAESRFRHCRVSTFRTKLSI